MGQKFCPCKKVAKLAKTFSPGKISGYTCTCTIFPHSYILFNVFIRVLGYFLWQLFDDDALALGQLSSVAVHRVDVSHLFQHLVVAVHPVEVLSSDVDLGATSSHQTPAEFLLCSEFLQPGEVFDKSVDGFLENRLEVGAHPSACADGLENFELWDDFFLEHAQNELLKIVLFFRDGGLHLNTYTCTCTCMHKCIIHMYIFVHSVAITIHCRHN